MNRYTKALDSIRTVRKERTAELKVDKERLQTLQVQKSHADTVHLNDARPFWYTHEYNSAQLRERIESLTSTLKNKQIKQEELKQKIQADDAENIRFMESATKFKEIYIKVETYEARKAQLQEEIETKQSTTQELQNTDEELQVKVRDFESNRATLQRRRNAAARDVRQEEERLADKRKQHVALINEHGNLQAEATVCDIFASSLTSFRMRSSIESQTEC